MGRAACGGLCLVPTEPRENHVPGATVKELNSMDALEEQRAILCEASRVRRRSQGPSPLWCGSGGAAMVTQDPSSFLVVAPPEDIYLCALVAPVSAL